MNFIADQRTEPRRVRRNSRCHEKLLLG